MKKIIFSFGIVGFLIGCYFPVFSILWELSEIRGACQNCPVNFWENITFLEIINILFMGIIGVLLGGSIGFLIYKLIKK